MREQILAVLERYHWQTVHLLGIQCPTMDDLAAEIIATIAQPDKELVDLLDYHVMVAYDGKMQLARTDLLAARLELWYNERSKINTPATQQRPGV